MTRASKILESFARHSIRESNLSIKWTPASSSDKAFISKLLGKEVTSAEQASVENGEDEIWYFKIDGRRYRVADNLKDVYLDESKVDTIKNIDDLTMEEAGEKLLAIAKKKFPEKASKFKLKGDKTGIYVTDGTDKTYLLLDVDTGDVEDLSEAYFEYNARQNQETAKAVTDLNKDRIGEPVLDIKGREIPNSLVLSPYDFARKDANGDLIIHSFNDLENSSSKIIVYKAEVQLLKKFL